MPGENQSIPLTTSSATSLTFDQACQAHRNYLENGPYIMDGAQIVHSLFVDSTSLAALANEGVGGMRLYFCKEPDTAQLNIILVPVKSDGDNSKSDIVNNLEPCPNMCPCNLTYAQSCSHNDLNYVHDQADNTDKWCKPNMQTINDASMWFDANGDNVAAPVA